MWAWDEQQGVTLASAIRVDLTSPGVYDQSGDLLTGVSIPAGTVVDSDYISSVGVANSGSSILDGTLSFPTDILGVMVLAGKLSSSDVSVRPAPITRNDRDELRPRVRYGSRRHHDGRPAHDHVPFGPPGRRHRRDPRPDQHDGAPTASAGGPYTGVEGTPLMLHGTASDAENDFLTYAWTFTTTSAKPEPSAPPRTRTP
jgi:hypothetical protein